MHCSLHSVRQLFDFTVLSYWQRHTKIKMTSSNSYCVWISIIMMNKETNLHEIINFKFLNLQRNDHPIGQTWRDAQIMSIDKWIYWDLIWCLCTQQQIDWTKWSAQSWQKVLIITSQCRYRPWYAVCVSVFCSFFLSLMTEKGSVLLDQIRIPYVFNVCIAHVVADKRDFLFVSFCCCLCKR